MTDITKQLADALRRYAHQDEQAGQTDNNLYRTAMAQLTAYEAQAALAEEPVAVTVDHCEFSASREQWRASSGERVNG